MLAQPVDRSPSHEPTSRRDAPDTPRRHTPGRGKPDKPGGPSRPKTAKTTKSTNRRGRRKSAPAGLPEQQLVDVLDLTHIPTLGTLPN